MVLAPSKAKAEDSGLEPGTGQLGKRWTWWVLWADLRPSSIYLPIAENGTVFGERVFKEVIRLRWSLGGPDPM